MIGRKPTLFVVADERQTAFLMIATDGRLERQAILPMDSAGADDPLAQAAPKWARQARCPLLVVPDYWIGNHCYEFQSRKRSIVTAFIERKLTLDQPSLTDAVNFYDYALVQDQDRRQMLYCTTLQDPMAYTLYRQLERLGIRPHRIATPALIWQAKLREFADGFIERGIGFVHLADRDCFLYFFNLGQFIFSRHIQLPEIGDDSSEIFNQLNYEINQSFYLYSQKTKRSVETLFMLAEDPAATSHLSELLGREVLELPPSSPGVVALDETKEFAAYHGFSTLDLKHHRRPSIFYRPLRKEMTWRPVQWAGMAVGIVLAILLVAEAGYLHLLQKNVLRQQSAMLTASATRPPEEILGELTQILDDVTGELGRPSGSGVMMRTLLAMPLAVSLEKITLDTVDSPRLTIDALVDADQPDAFKTILDEFLNRLNRRFNLEHHPLQEKDIQIGLERKEHNERQPLYQIHFSFELT